jgi:hypothetical protein
VSTARGQGAGVVKAARDHLTKLPLSWFSVRTEKLFRARLDAATRSLSRALPQRSRSWGLSRKLLNIFLRDALYNQYLARHHKLDRAEGFMEIPLDSISGGRLRELATAGTGSPVEQVKGLTSADSRRYQVFASTLAGGRARVHLDTEWWGRR